MTVQVASRGRDSLASQWLCVTHADDRRVDRSERRPAIVDAPVTEDRPRLCFVAPLLGRIGRTPDSLELLSDLMREDGWSCLEVSHQPNRYLRLADILTFLWRRRAEYDLIVMQIYGGRSFVVEDAASRLGRLLGKRMVGILAGGALPTFLGRHRRWARRVLQRYDQLVAPSTFLAQVDVDGVHPVVIPNAIRIHQYHFRERRDLVPRILWMRAFGDAYEPELAVRVLAQLRRTHPSASLTMAGRDFGHLEATRALARELGVSEAVRFVGFLDPASKGRALDEHDVFLHTNSIDNMPVTLLEAAASGLPIVATRVGGVPHRWSDGIDCLLVESGDVMGYANAVSSLVGDDQRVQRLTAGALEVLEQSREDRVVAQWRRLVDRLGAA